MVLYITIACCNKKFKIGAIIMIGFIIGLFVGAFIGVFIMCLCNAASNVDENMKKLNELENREDDVND